MEFSRSWFIHTIRLVEADPSLEHILVINTRGKTAPSCAKSDEVQALLKQSPLVTRGGWGYDLEPRATATPPGNKRVLYGGRGAHIFITKEQEDACFFSTAKVIPLRFLCVWIPTGRQTTESVP